MKELNNLSLESGKYLSRILPLGCVQVLNNEVICTVHPQYIPFVLTFLRDHVSQRATKLGSVKL